MEKRIGESEDKGDDDTSNRREIKRKRMIARFGYVRKERQSPNAVTTILGFNEDSDILVHSWESITCS